MTDRKLVTIYTDGACSGNPGPGGWGAILEFNGIEKELSGGDKQPYGAYCRYRGTEMSEISL